MINRKIKLGIEWILKNGETVNLVANTFDISPRREEQFVKLFKEPGNISYFESKKKTESVPD